MLSTMLSSGLTAEGSVMRLAGTVPYRLTQLGFALRYFIAMRSRPSRRGADDPRETVMMTQHDPSLFASRRPYQHGYVTTDVERAMEHLGREMGISRFSVSDRTLTPSSLRGPMSIQCRIALAYVDDLMIEIIEPVGGDADIYTSVLPGTGFKIVLHHLAYLVDDAVDWAGFCGRVAPESFMCASSGPVFYLYVDTYRALGHYLEYIKIGPDHMAALRARVPAN
jgi:hypothetical protein